MNDESILAQIETLVEEEHTLMHAAEERDLNDEEHVRMRALQIKLDQCWDLLRQRRARREFGLNPDEVTVRDPNIVEHFNQ